jgi:hypothetical protein
MSIAVSIERLRDEVARFGSLPYLLTVSADAHAHATAVTIEWQGDDLVMGVGAQSSRNAAVHPEVSLLWAPFEPGGYSLIADGVIRDIGNEQMAFAPTRAVLHRPGVPAAAKPDSSCTSDCVPLIARV